MRGSGMDTRCNLDSSVTMGKARKVLGYKEWLEGGSFNVSINSWVIKFAALDYRSTISMSLGLKVLTYLLVSSKFMLSIGVGTRSNLGSIYGLTRPMSFGSI